MTRGGSSADSAGASTELVLEMMNEMEDLSLPDDSYESSSASMTPSLAPVAIRSPLDLPYFRNTLAPLLAISGPENPFVELVLPLADRSDTLLNAICMVAKAHQAQGNPAATPSSYLDLCQLVLRGLRSSVTEASTSDRDLPLAANALLAIFEVRGITFLTAYNSHVADDPEPV